MGPQRREQQELRLVEHQPLEEADLGRGGVVEKKDGLPTDNREKKGKGIGRKKMGGEGGDRESGDSELKQRRSGGKRQWEQDSCYENQAVKSLTGLSLRNCPAVTGVFWLEEAGGAGFVL